MNDQDNMKAFFVQRLFAYIIDMFVIALIASLVTYPFANTDSVNKLSLESEQILENYQKGKIDMITYFNQSMDISYEQARITGLSSVITVVILVLYFIVYQIYNNGQTLGKKIMKIKIVDNNDEELTMNNMIIRGLFNNLIFIDIVLLIVNLFGKNAYLVSSLVLEFIQYTFIFISIIMILIRKDGRSLADFLAKTKVIRTDICGSEVNLCES